jgi:hypothetical protein
VRSNASGHLDPALDPFVFTSRLPGSDNVTTMRLSSGTAPATVTITVLALAVSSVVAISAPAHADDPAAASGNVVINEFSSNGWNGNIDFIELYNTGTANVDLTGYHVTDDQGIAGGDDVVLDGTLVAGGFAVIFPDDATYGELGFGLGKSDEVHLLGPDGLTVIDAYTGLPDGQHAAPSYARTTDGTGVFALATAATPGGPNSLAPTPDAASIKLNEFDTQPDDFIELYNAGIATVNLAGWQLSDGENGTQDATDELVLGDIDLAPGAYLSITPDTLTMNPAGIVASAMPADGFGLNKNDGIWLRNASDVLIDRADDGQGAQHAGGSEPVSYGRALPGFGLWKTTYAATAGTLNSFTEPEPAEPSDDPALGSVVVNEVSSNGFTHHGAASTDFIELYNRASENVDLTGYVLSDSNGFASAERMVLDGALPAGGYAVFIPPAFGVGNDDAATLFSPSGQVIDEYVFPSHRLPSWARIPNGTGDFVIADGAGGGPVPTPGGPNGLTTAQAYVSINEYSSDPADFIELHNDSDASVDLTGWKLADGEGTPVVGDEIILGGASAIIPPGGYLSVATQSAPPEGTEFVDGGFGLGKADRVYLFTPEGALADTTWVGPDAGGVTRHASPSWARTTPGTGLWKLSSEGTAGLENVFAPIGEPGNSSIVINEVTNVGGHVELLNTGSEAVDLSGVEFRNGAGELIHTVPAATMLAGGDFYYVGGLTGLASTDTLTIADGGGGTLDTFTWEEDGIASYQRCEAFGVWTLSELPTATFDAVNACPQPGGTPWPGSQDVTIVDDTNTFGDGDGNGEGDVSGASFDPIDPSILWSVQNKNTVFKLTKNPTTGKYDDVPGWNGGKKLHFANGSGQPDTEGVTVGPDGALYITSERDNANKDVSYNKILRFDVSGDLSTVTDLTATREWDVNGDITTGTNLGLEGITWVPDSVLTAGAFTTNGGGVYLPGDYTNHGSGLFFVAVEGTGELHAFALPHDGDTTGAPALVTTLASGFPFSMDVTWDADRELLWALCDDGCGGAVNTLELVDGEFGVTGSYARPTGMPNLNNEGLAIAPFRMSDGDYQEVVWTDDGDTGGNSLRGGLLWRTADLSAPVHPLPEDPAPPVTENPTPPVTQNPAPTQFAIAPTVTLSSNKPKVGSPLRAEVTQPTPAADATTYRWTVDGTTVSTRALFTPRPKHAGQKVTVTVTFTKAGLIPVSRTVQSARIAPKATATTLKHSTVKRGGTQKASFSNLVPGTEYAVFLRGKKIDTVTANAYGIARVAFEVSTKKGTVKVSVKVGSKRPGKRFTVR